MIRRIPDYPSGSVRVHAADRQVGLTGMHELDEAQCQEPGHGRAWTDRGRQHVRTERAGLGPWTAGNTGTEGVWQWRSPSTGPHLMISAVIHGNELCGAHALRDLLRWIDATGWRPPHGALTLVLGHLEALRRFSPSDPSASRGVGATSTASGPQTVWRPCHGRGQAGRGAGAFRRPGRLPAGPALDAAAQRPSGAGGHGAQAPGLGACPGPPMHTMCDEGHANGCACGIGDASQGAGDACAVLVECRAHGGVESLVVAWDAMARCLEHLGLMRRSALPPHWVAPAQPERWTLEVTHAVVAKSAQFNSSRFPGGWNACPWRAACWRRMSMARWSRPTMTAC